MNLTRSTIAGLCIVAITVVSAFIYSLWKKNSTDDFSCTASLSQHYSDEQIDISLSYAVHGESGIISINGHSKTEPKKIFNRKISFTLSKNENIYHLTSDKNIKFPDDNVDNSWFSQYEPEFFVFEKKNIYMQIIRQKNDNYLFMTDFIPTYVCKKN